MHWKKIFRDEDGSTLIITALAMVVLLGFIGLSLDIGKLRLSKRQLQGAADAAALAAAIEINSCHNQANCSALQTAAQTSMVENGFLGSTLVTNCGTAASSGVTLTVNNPPCAQGSADPNSGNQSYVEVVASEKMGTYFASILGFRTMPISVRSEAAKTPNPNCIYALDTGAANAISVSLLASISSPCGIMDESSASNAFACNLAGAVTATQINVVGGTLGTLCAAGTTVTTGAALPSPLDPLATLPKPTVLPCGSSITSPFHGAAGPILIIGSAVLYPDAAYCGGITIAAANVTFTPGTYVIKSGGVGGTQGGLTVSALANITGNGVTFYNYGPYGAVSFLAPSLSLGTVSLVAPTSGTYAGVLFFQDAQDTAAATIFGSASSNTDLEGAYYFPGAAVNFAASSTSNYNFLIAKTITFSSLSLGTVSVQSTFASNYSSLTNGSPLAGGASVLVQ